MLKGMGIGAIIKLVLAIMIASLFISISTVGSLGDALSQSFEDVERVSGEKAIEIENSTNLGWAVTLTRERALNEGCGKVENRNEDEGYPGLEGTYLTTEPPCYGGEAGILRGPEGIFNQGGLGADENFMSGIYSREKIEVTDNITLRPGDINIQAKGGEHITGVYKGTPRYMAKEYDVKQGGLDGGDKGAIIGELVAGPPGEVIGETLGNWGDEQPKIAKPFFFFEEGEIINRTGLDEGDVEDAQEGNPISISGQDIYLCEGDEGYVQANRGGLGEFGHADGSPLVPIIVIDDVQYEECEPSGDDDSDIDVDILQITREDPLDSQYKQMGYEIEVENNGGLTRTLYLRFKDINGKYVGQHPSNSKLDECTLGFGESSLDECGPEYFTGVTGGGYPNEDFNIETDGGYYCAESEDPAYTAHAGVFGGENAGSQKFILEVWDLDEDKVIKTKELYGPPCTNGCEGAETPEDYASGNC